MGDEDPDWSKPPVVVSLVRDSKIHRILGVLTLVKDGQRGAGENEYYGAFRKFNSARGSLATH